MIISTRAITEEYYDDTLIISVLETDRGGTTFSTVSAVQEIVFLGGEEERGPPNRGSPGAKPVLKIPVHTAF